MTFSKTPTTHSGNWHNMQGQRTTENRHFMETAATQ